MSRPRRASWMTPMTGVAIITYTGIAVILIGIIWAGGING